MCFHISNFKEIRIIDILIILALATSLLHVDPSLEGADKDLKKQLRTCTTRMAASKHARELHGFHLLEYSSWDPFFPVSLVISQTVFESRGSDGL